jgi:hypothetical protein
VKDSGDSRLVLADGDERTVVVVAETRLAVMLGGQAWVVDIVAVPCLGGRLRPLLKCPRAHEGNFQSLYYRVGMLACRHCHGLRYSSNLAATPQGRNRLARIKLLATMGHGPGTACPARLRGRWRGPYGKSLMHLAALTTSYRDLIARKPCFCVPQTCRTDN